MPIAKDTKNIDWQEWFYYDETSPTCLRNKTTRSNARAGDVSGYFQKSSGYYVVKFKNKQYRVHRVVFELTSRRLETWEKIDHVDGNPLNNSTENLRAVEEQVNQRNKRMYSNNKTGVTGVTTAKVGEFEYFVAYFYNETGKQLSKYFSVKSHGSLGAFELAVKWRQDNIRNSENYTDRHGKL